VKAFIHLGFTLPVFWPFARQAIVALRFDPQTRSGRRDIHLLINSRKLKKDWAQP